MPGGSGAAFTDPNGHSTLCGNLSVRVIYTNTLGGTRYYGAWKYNNTSGARVTATTTKFIVGGVHNVSFSYYPEHFPFTT